VPKVHIAFYLWYGTPEVDGKWMHWNHKVLPHWDPATDARYKKFDWRPPEEPHSPFMPLLGTYSSRDPSVLEQQFQDLAAAGVDSAMCSWWGRKDWKGKRDDAHSGANTDELMPAVLDAAAAAKVGVSIHVEPYEGRSATTFLEDLRYIHESYGSHPGLYRDQGLPIFWLYDVSVQHSHQDLSAWSEAIASVRGTSLDAIFLCLYIGEKVGDLDDLAFVTQGGFDGAYSYFAATRFTKGSTPLNWKTIVKSFADRGKIFIPAVGPGYDDRRIRPWNKQNWRPRKQGAYYDEMWTAAIDANPAAISVTSFNEWGEATQIEAAQPYTSPNGLKHEDYLPEDPHFYIRKTKEWAQFYRSQTPSES